MKSLFQKFKMPIIIIGILIVSFIIFKTFFGGASSDQVLTADTSNSDVGQIFVNQLQELRQISLDPSIFSDPEFQSLSDFSQPLPNIPVGRDNPFAPITGSIDYSGSSSNSNVVEFNSVPAATSSSSAPKTNSPTMR